MTVVKNHNVNKAYEVYLALYQGLTGSDDSRNIFKQFSPDFFDLIVVDECHRGSARDDSAWREILEYFSNGNTNRFDGNAERNGRYKQQRIFRRSDLYIFAQTRN